MITGAFDRQIRVWELDRVEVLSRSADSDVVASSASARKKSRRAILLNILK